MLMPQPEDDPIVIHDPTHLLVVVHADRSESRYSRSERRVREINAGGHVWKEVGDTYEAGPNHLVITTEHGGCTVIPTVGLRQWKVRSVAEDQAEKAYRKAREAEINARLDEEELAARQAARSPHAMRGL